MIGLQAIGKSISPYNAVPTIVTLIFVICLSVVREIFEDIERYATDLRVNTSHSVKYQRGKWTRTSWKNIYVGDVLRIKNNETVPADCICLATSNYDKNFYLQTNAINGRTSLTKRKTIETTQSLVGNGETFRLVAECEMSQVDQDLD